MKNKNLWGMETSLDLAQCNPEAIRSAKYLRNYVIKLCKLIGAQRHGDVIIEDFGEDEKIAGFSFVQLIQTSLISGHLVNSTNAAYINIFSCKAYDVDRAVEFTRKYFEAKDCQYIVNYRNILK
jgi:S-adenosylmethionine/arginine decarboxylase-like enzyme